MGTIKGEGEDDERTRLREGAGFLGLERDEKGEK